MGVATTKLNYLKNTQSSGARGSGITIPSFKTRVKFGAYNSGYPKAQKIAYSSVQKSAYK